MNQKPICILIDTNMWRRTLLLNSALGSALLYTINNLQAKLAFPEVIEMEIEKHIYNIAIDAKYRIERGYREIGAILGSYHQYKLPSNDDILTAISKKIEKISPLLIKVPFTLEHAKKALERVNNGIPPSSTKQQQ